MRKIMRTAVFLLALIVFLGSGSVVLGKVFQYYQGQDAYANVEELAGVADVTSESTAADMETVPADGERLDDGEPDTEMTPEDAGENGSSEPENKPKKEKKTSVPVPQITMDGLKNLDMDALKKVNKDVEGWILLPDTKISYPVMQAEDNEFYLSRTWDKSWNWMGSIFVEAFNKPDFSEFNTIIYGHNLKNSSMFSSLKSYSSKKYWKQHPSVYLANESGVYKYNIFAAYEVAVDGHAFWLDITDEKVKEAFIQNSIKMSDIDTGIEPETSDRIITLSTCTGAGHESRWVVQAVLDEVQQ